MRYPLVAFALILLIPSAALYAESFSGFLNTEFAMHKLSPLNHFLFLLPPLAWNIAFTAKLDMGAFSGKVPAWYEGLEWAFRAGVFIFPLFLPIEAKSPRFIPGLSLYAAGTILYFASWLPYMRTPPPAWAENPLLRFAPAYLPSLWLGGISLMSGSWIQAGLSLIFLGLHVGEYLMRW